MSAGPEALVYVLLAPSSTLSLQASDICDEKSEIIDQLGDGLLVAQTKVAGNYYLRIQGEQIL